METNVRFHPRQRDALQAVIKEALPKIIVTRNMFLDSLSTAIIMLAVEGKFEKHGKNRSLLEGIIGEFAFSGFIRDQVSIRLLEKDDYQTEPQYRSLLDSIGKDACDELSTQLVPMIETLPWSYALTIELSERLSSELREVHSDDVEIGRLSLSVDADRAHEYFPIDNLEPSINTRIFGHEGILSSYIGSETNPKRRWNADRVRLHQFCSGYIDVYGALKTAEEAERLVKSFVGLCFALRVLRYERRYGQSRGPSYVLCHRLFEGGKSELIHRYRLSERVSVALDDCRAYFTGHSDPDKRVHAQKWARSRLPKMAGVFEDVSKHRRLLSACSWLFDSYTNDDRVLGFVQAMIVLEILLGDDEPSGELTLGALLRNRCAYLISKSIEERKEIADSLKKIYDVRSKIVHRGKSDLSTGEQSMYREILDICCRVVIAEFDFSVGRAD